jgi:hypothetical protein
MIQAPRPTRRPWTFALLPLWLAFCGMAVAGSHEVALHGPNGNGADCDSVAATTPPDAASPKPVPAPPVKRATHVKPVVTVRDGDDGSSHAPRWHSFLPGMFR